jgi:hypothetical protein
MKNMLQYAPPLLANIRFKLGFNLLKLFWRKLTYSFYKLDHIIQSKIFAYVYKMVKLTNKCE